MKKALDFRELDFELYEISDARSILMGVATLWVALFHSYDMNFRSSARLTGWGIADALNLVKGIGNCGVDVFLFLSGFGLYFALENNGDIRRFYRRRLVRILPETLIVSIIYYGFIGAAGLSDWLGKVFLYGFVVKGMDGGRYWYFALALILYLAYPALHVAIKKRGGV